MTEKSKTPIKSFKSFVPEKKEEPFYHKMHPQLKHHFNVEKDNYDENEKPVKKLKEAAVYHPDEASHPHKVKPMVNKDEHFSLIDYSLSSRSVNAALHRNHRDTSDHKDLGSHKTIKHLDNVFSDKANHVGVAHTVYSGVPESPANIVKKESERIGKPAREVHAHLPAYTSTSSDGYIAHDFAKPVKHIDPKSGRTTFVKHILKINVPAHHPSISMKYHSEHDQENEILLHRGTRIKIKAKPVVQTDEYGDKMHIWHADVVGHEPDEIKASKQNKIKKVENMNQNKIKKVENITKHFKPI